MSAAAFRAFEAAPRWVVWRNERRGEKVTKVPYMLGGRRAKSDNPATWGTRAAVEAAVPKIVNGLGGGVGIQLGDLGDDFSLGGIDLDTCLGPDGMFEAWAIEVIKRFGSYAEISPSGTGTKVFFKYRTENLPRLRQVLGVSKYGKQFKRANGKDHPPAIEVYLGNRYFAITEQRLEWAPDRIVTVDAETILWLVRWMQRNVSDEDIRRWRINAEEFGQALRDEVNPGKIWQRQVPRPNQL